MRQAASRRKDAGNRIPEGCEMRLFKRKPDIDDAVRCPNCRERLPDDDAAECAMCGFDVTGIVEARRRADEGVASKS